MSTKLWVWSKKIGFTLLIIYWLLAGLLGTLLMANYIVMQRVPDMERIVFSSLAMRYYRHHGDVVMCPANCFEGDLIVRRGFRIDKPEDLN